MKREIRKKLSPNLLKALKEYDVEHEGLVHEVVAVDGHDEERLMYVRFCFRDVLNSMMREYIDLRKSGMPFEEANAKLGMFLPNAFAYSPQRVCVIRYWGQE